MKVTLNNQLAVNEIYRMPGVTAYQRSTPINNCMKNLLNNRSNGLQISTTDHALDIAYPTL